MQVAVLFTVRLLWRNGIELLSCQSPVLLLLDWLLRLYTSTLKPQSLGNQPEGSASNTATKQHFSHGDAVWRERKDIAGQRDEHLVTTLLSPHAFNLWLPHWSKDCGSCMSHRNHDAGPALQKPLAGWRGNRTPAQSRVQLRDHVLHLSPTQRLAPHLCHRNHGPCCPVTQFWCFPSEPSCQLELSKLFFPIYLEESQRLPELPFLPASSLHQLREAFIIYRGSEGVLCTVLEISSLHQL